MIRPITLFALAVALPLGGCLLPDDYEANLVLSRDGGYSYTYEGRAFYVDAIRSLRDAKAAGAEAVAKIRDDLDRMANKIAQEPWVRSFAHLGDGLFAIDVERTGMLPRENHLRETLPLGLLSAIRANDRLVVEFPGLGAEEIRALSALGISSKGRLCIETDMAVIEHNADETPGPHGEAYCWELDLMAGDSVRMVMARR